MSLVDGNRDKIEAMRDSCNSGSPRSQAPAGSMGYPLVNSEPCLYLRTNKDRRIPDSASVRVGAPSCSLSGQNPSCYVNYT